MSTVNFFGAASGLDTGSLINALIEKQYQSRIAPLENKVSNLSDQNSALDKLSSKLSALNDAASAFSTLSGGAVAHIATSSDETVLTASAGKSAYNSSLSVNVIQVASNTTSSFNDTFGSTADVINSGASSGTVDFTIGTGTNAENFSISVDNTTTVDEFVSQFNASSENAVATTVNVGTASSPQYKIVISSTHEGTEKGQVATVDSGAFFSGQTLEQATDAQFTISGISGVITRSSNSVSDVVPGLTLNLSKVGSATVSIQSDSEATAADFQKFVDTYNDLVSYIKEQDAVTINYSGGQPNAVFGALSSSSLDESALSTIKSAFSSSSIGSGSIHSLADLGITTQKDGTLAFNEDTFAAALSADAGEVKNIAAKLGDSLSKTGGVIDQFTQFNGLIDSSVQSNKEEIDRTEQNITKLQSSLDKQQENLINQYSKLEAQISSLQSQQFALSAILESLSQPIKYIIT